MEIPGQPFPPVILSAFAIYLTTLSTLAWPHLPKHVNTSRETRVNSGELPNAILIMMMMMMMMMMMTIKQMKTKGYGCME